MPSSESARVSVEEPRWPLVVGSLCVFYAIHSLIESLYLLVGCLPDVIESSRTLLGRPARVWYLALWFLRDATAIGALVAGILICRRARSALAVIRAYAGVTMLLNLAVAIGAGLAFGPRLIPYGIACHSLNMATSMALPVFLLIWFARPAVRQGVAGWGEGKDSCAPATGPRWPCVVAAASFATACVDFSLGIRGLVGLLYLVRWIAQGSPVGLTGALGRVSEQSFPPVIALPLAPLLVAGAILLLKRHPVAAWLHLIWAGMTLLLAVVYAEEDAYPVIGTVMRGFDLPPSSVEVEALWRMGRLALYPVFLFIWFLRPRIRHELRGWAAQRAP